MGLNPLLRLRKDSPSTDLRSEEVRARELEARREREYEVLRSRNEALSSLQTGRKDRS